MIDMRSSIGLTPVGEEAAFRFDASPAAAALPPGSVSFDMDIGSVSLEPEPSTQSHPAAFSDEAEPEVDGNTAIGAEGLNAIEDEEDEGATTIGLLGLNEIPEKAVRDGSVPLVFAAVVGWKALVPKSSLIPVVVGATTGFARKSPIAGAEMDCAEAERELPGAEMEMAGAVMELAGGEVIIAGGEVDVVGCA